MNKVTLVSIMIVCALFFTVSIATAQTDSMVVSNAHAAKALQLKAQYDQLSAMLLPGDTLVVPISSRTRGPRGSVIDVIKIKLTSDQKNAINSKLNALKTESESELTQAKNWTPKKIIK